MTAIDSLRLSSSVHRTWPAFDSEHDTIRKAQLGDTMAWETLVRRNVGWILQTCTRWVRSRARAEDLTQEVFLRVFQTLHSYRGEVAGFRIWLGRITRNLLVDDYRRNRRERGIMSYEGADEKTQFVIRSFASNDSRPEAEIEREERRTALRSALRLLNPELRETVTLRDVQGLSYREISRLQRTPIGTVKSRVNRGRIELIRLVRHRQEFDPSACTVFAR